MAKNQTRDQAQFQGVAPDRRYTSRPEHSSAWPKAPPQGSQSRLIIDVLDTNVVSELRRARPHGAVLAWLQQVRDEDISAVTIGKIQSGIAITREQDQAKAAEMETWLEQVAETYNVVSMDARTFRVWARQAGNFGLMHRRTDDLIEYAMVAATAAIHRLTIATRNLRDFERFPR